jgi:hypothetical protein
MEVIEMDAHTKGPWKVAEGKKADELFIEASTRKGGRIARLWNGRTGRNANAKLIAAAPDMLEALEQVAEALDNGTLTHKRIALVFDAIKKAKGDL